LRQKSFFSPKFQVEPPLAWFASKEGEKIRTQSHEKGIGKQEIWKNFKNQPPKDQKQRKKTCQTKKPSKKKGCF